MSILADKSGLLTLYLCGLLICLGIPFAQAALGRTIIAPRWQRFLTIALPVFALSLTARRMQLWDYGFALVAIPLSILLWKQGITAIIGGISATAVFMSATSWVFSYHYDILTSTLFLTIGAGAFALTLAQTTKQGLPVLLAAVATVLAIALSHLLVGVFGLPGDFRAIWHHWSAYAASTQALHAGAIPFRDFPIQYGLGPTLVIALLDGADPLVGVYEATFIANVLNALALVTCLACLVRKASRGVALLLFADFIASLLLWGGNPADVIGPLSFPSGGGLRYLPLTSLMALILYSEFHRRLPIMVFFVVWIIGLGWSPEGAFYVSIMLWPWLCLRRIQEAGGRKIHLILLAYFAVSVSATIIALAILAAVFRGAFGYWPSLSGYAEYIINPPAPEAYDPIGPIWIIIGGIVVGIAALSTTDTRQLRAGLVSLLGLFAALAYWLGHSNDSVVLSFFLPLVLVLAAAGSTDQPRLIGGFSRMVQVAMLAWAVMLGYQSWNLAIGAGLAGVVGPARIWEGMRLRKPVNQRGGEEPSFRLTSNDDLITAIAWLRTLQSGPVVVVDQKMVMPRDMPGPAWTSVNNIANFDPLPEAAIRRYIARGAAVFHRPGWMLVDRAYDRKPWLAYFQGAYRITEQRDFGGYTAYRLEPG